jgi:hypothetical protein
LKPSNEAAKKYLEEIVEEERFDSAITIVMRATAKAKATSYRGKF